MPLEGFNVAVKLRGKYKGVPKCAGKKHSFVAALAAIIIGFLASKLAF